MRNFDSLVNEILNEADGMTASGANSVLGAGAGAGYANQSQIPNKDTYAPNDARVVKLLGSKVIKRNMPKDTIFKGNVKRRRKHKRKHKK
jgi:hypothetical protein